MRRGGSASGSASAGGGGGGDGNHDGNVNGGKPRSQSRLSIDAADEDNGVVGPIVGGIEENAWQVGSRWVAPPSAAADYKDFFKGEMARKFTLQGGLYPAKVHASDKQQMIFRCSTIPGKEHESKLRKEMKASGQEHAKFSLKDATTCPFVVGFRKKEEKVKRAAGWYLTQYHERHHEECAMDDRKRTISVNAFKMAGVKAIGNYVPLQGRGPVRGSTTQLLEQANRQEGDDNNHVQMKRWAARKIVRQASQGGMYDHLTNVTKLVSMIKHARANDPEGIYILHTTQLSYDIPGVRKYVHLTSPHITSQLLTSPPLPSSRHSYSRSDAREIDFVYVMPAAAVKFFEHAGSCLVGSLDAAHRAKSAACRSYQRYDDELQADKHSRIQVGTIELNPRVFSNIFAATIHGYLTHFPPFSPS